MFALRVLGLVLAFEGICRAQETWIIGPRQRDPGAVEELLERAAGTGARVWRDGARFLVAGALDDLPRETGVAVEPVANGDSGDIVQTTDFAPQGSVRGSGEIVTLDHAENSAFLGTSFLLDRVEGVAWGEDGSVILDSAYASGSSARALNFARQFGLRITMRETVRAAYELKRPRVGLSSASAWVAALLDRYRVPFERAPSAGWRSKFDTVVVGDDADGAVWREFAAAGGTVVRVPDESNGSFTKVKFESGAPIAFGMPREEWVRSGGSGDRLAARAHVLASFVDPAGPAITEETAGQGRVISFAFPPVTYATCKLLLNAVYLGSARRL